MTDSTDSPARTSTGAEPKPTRLTLAAGPRVRPHEHPGRDIVRHLLEGAIELLLGDDTYDLTAGDIARFDGAQDSSPYAIEDSTALIVLATATDD